MVCHLGLCAGRAPRADGDLGVPRQLRHREHLLAPFVAKRRDQALFHLVLQAWVIDGMSIAGLEGKYKGRDTLVEEGMVDNAARLGSVMRSEMDRLQAKHPSVRAGRCIGLFGMMDVQGPDGELIAGFNNTHPLMSEMSSFFRKEGLFTFVRWSHFMCNPPLCITEDELLHGFEIIDRGLDITDRAFE